MDILPGFKLCRKRLHQYPADKRTCPECARASWRKYHNKNKEKKKTYQKEWYKKNKEQKDAANKKWQQKNKNRVSCYQKEWYQLNKDKRRAVGKKWEQNNKDKVNASKAKRRALEKQAMPVWADLQAIKNIYKEAVKLTRKTGIRHEVDHIYPLQNKYMCGLHIETNLQILTKSENSAKSNRTWPGQLECQKKASYETHNLRIVLRASWFRPPRMKEQRTTPMCTYVIGVGEWLQTLSDRMNSAVDGDLFVLPSTMHLHAYSLLKESSFPTKKLKVELKVPLQNL